MNAKAINLEGICDPRFRAVENAFRRNFADEWETEGAAFAVYYKGELVVDLYGGYADSSCQRFWRYDTMSTLFSATKALCAICFAKLIDEGEADYDDLVSKWWPEFGVNGKETITIGMVLTHTAGLVHFDDALRLEHLSSPTKMAKLIESMKPVHTPGVCSAYQAITFGWILDQVMMRVDPRKRTIAQYFYDEFGSKYDLDLHIGLAKEDVYRVTRLKNFSIVDSIKETCFDLRLPIIGFYYFNPCGYFYKIRKDLRCAGKEKKLKVIQAYAYIKRSLQDFTMFNNPELAMLEMPAVNGVGTARALARTMHVFCEPEFVSQKLLDRIAVPEMTQFDHTIGETLSKSCGFMNTKNPEGNWIFGHMGVGGQNVKVDIGNGISFAYLTNGMKAAVGDHVRSFRRLQNSVYRALDELRTSEEKKVPIS